MNVARGRIVLSLITAVLAVAVSLGALEVACRMLDVPMRFREPRAEHVVSKFDAELGWAYAPNSSVITRFGSDERMIPSHFDELGARVRAREVRHDPAAPTAIFVGDSFTMGHGVVFDDT